MQALQGPVARVFRRQAFKPGLQIVPGYRLVKLSHPILTWGRDVAIRISQMLRHPSSAHVLGVLQGCDSEQRLQFEIQRPG